MNDRDLVVDKYPAALALHYPASRLAMGWRPGYWVIQNAFGSHRGDTEAAAWASAAESLRGGKSAAPRQVAREDVFEAADRFVGEEVSALPLVTRLRRVMKQGCGDSSCEFRRPTGQSTNSGCCCWDLVQDVLEFVRDG